MKMTEKKGSDYQKDLIKDIIQWDTKSWSIPLEFWNNNVDWDNIHDTLELGSYWGGLSLWLALKGKNVVCSDLKNTRKIAEPLHIKYGVTANIEYKDIDAKNIPYTNSFDLIVFKSIIGGIGENNHIELQQKVFDEIHKALKPGGKLLFAENLVGSIFHQILRRNFVSWGKSWRFVTTEELKYFLREFSSYDLRTTGVIGALGRNEQQRRIFASFDKLILNKLCPRNWNYIGYGIAEK
ncbi:MAG TPA: class I SAM-dependent methyltransferase [Bacteroidales bacterium]|jgi:2-polyprenyl-3-methyl-5-hydroxy-6-metoxy-1,4-benzoquinol methylase|nr:class I SAM-dependent methyltransferase [Bacteroidales bacterium]